jgi:hypothetical protein
MPQCRSFDIEGFRSRPVCAGVRTWRRQVGAIGAVAKTLTAVRGLFQSVLTQASREATYDSNRAAGQTVDVVPDGTGQMAEGVASQQSLQSWSLEPAEKRAISDFLPANPLAVSGEVLQMLRLGMHDVEMVRPGGENGLLRVSRQSPAELVFRLMSPPRCGERPGGERTPEGTAAFRLLPQMDHTRRSRNAAAGAGGDTSPDDVSPALTSVGGLAPMEQRRRQR